MSAHSLTGTPVIKLLSQLRNIPLYESVTFHWDNLFQEKHSVATSVFVCVTGSRRVRLWASVVSISKAVRNADKQTPCC